MDTNVGFARMPFVGSKEHRSAAVEVLSKHVSERMGEPKLSRRSIPGGLRNDETARARLTRDGGGHYGFLNRDTPEVANPLSKGDRMHSAAIILALCGLLGGLLTAAQVGQTSETRTGALTSTDRLVSQEVVTTKEAKTANSHQTRILARIQAHTAASQNSAPGVANAAANTESRRIQNIAPEEMWNRVAQCVFPKYPALAIDAHITGTVDIGIGVSPEGDVGKNSRVLDGPPLLVQSAMDAIRQWKFRPNEVQGEVTWSRARALVRFNTDGTTAVDFAPAILADNFGDPGTPKSAAAALPRPSTSPACKSVDAPAQAPMFVDGAYIAGIGGLSYPKCVACPDPSYSDQARSAKVSGIVVLRLIVTAEGHASNIQVTRSLGYGLDENAIETVRNWQFKPVVGLEEKPVPVWTDIEVNFRIK